MSIFWYTCVDQAPRAGLEATEALATALQSLPEPLPLPHSPLSTSFAPASVHLPLMSVSLLCTTSLSLRYQLLPLACVQRSASMAEHSHRPAASNGAPAEAGTYETVTLHVAGEAPADAINNFLSIL